MATSTSVSHISQEYVDKTAQLKRELHAAKNVARQKVDLLAFADLLALCHNEMAEVQVESEPAKCATSTVGKIDKQLLRHPLREWTEFAYLQPSIFAQVSDNYKYPHPSRIPSPTLTT